MSNQMMEMLENARIASWVNFQSWLMSDGEKMKIAMNESDKNWLENIGYLVVASFRCGEQID